MMGARTGNPVWKDAPDTSTLVTAARLNAIEDAIDDSAEADHTHDARYYTKGQTDALLSGATPSAASGSLNRALSLTAARLANVDSAPFVVLFVGDSLTWSGSAWVDRFIKKLGIANDLTGTVLKSRTQGDVSVPASGIYGVNCATDGASSSNYVVNNNSVAMATAAQPALIIHGVGTNDFLGSQPLANYKANVTAAIASLDAACTVLPVHLLWWFGSNYNETKPYTSDQYIQQLLDIAATNPGRVAVADLGPYADTLGVHAADPYGLSGGDGIHLDVDGSRTIGELLARVVLDAPPAGVLGYSAAAPGTTTTTTTAGTTTTTTTAAGTTTTTTTSGGAVEFAYLDSDTHTTSSTIHTFAGMDLGEAAAGREIIVAVGVGGQFISGVTVAGVSATQDVKHDGGSTSVAYIGRATVPTGTTGDVVVTLTGGADRCCVALWRASGPVTAASTNTITSVDLSTAAGDFCVFAGTRSQAWPGWTGTPTPTERAVLTMGSSWTSGFADVVASGATVTASATAANAAVGAAYRGA